ncbi:hypothetical protein FB446DRAFT_782946 [Lentinula raphanica]|uniref:Uncharacterized protein n=1 Tax=Lentinula raphanica TaxID=153919 RepID=A0AA38PM64_9AGAR|nr:hypothetical protein C8R42DRAFT_720033 [Lentinula raphanica]KAJ3778808.1 hypothetical protein FB446DRAFT_782946 [Lentinula raphanica]KAJ3821988.1 hypothetical protein F5880DRAFT_1614210 [Lentinula raphanica]KAJ3845140.1 hypothetical protein F5878DRAFT_390280 [Lentinula raphanica]
MSSNPGSPFANQKNKSTNSNESSSPSSTLSGSSNNILSTSLHTLAQEASRTSLRGMFPSSNSNIIGTRKPIIRSDPSILTCFDPADKELYDLWAPKK